MSGDARDPFATRLREAIEESGLRLEDVAQRSSRPGATISPVTLSYWQRGLTRPVRKSSRRVLPALEVELGLLPGTLGEALYLTIEGEGHTPEAEPLRCAREWWGLQRPEGLVREFAMITCEVDERGGHFIRSQALLRATRQGADRLVLGMAHGAPIELQGCRLGRSLALPGHNLVARELLLPRPLARGAVWSMSFSLPSVEPEEAAEEFRAIATQATELFVARVLLPGRGAPQRVRIRRHWVDSDLAEHDDELGPLSVLPGSAAQTVLREVRHADLIFSWR